MKRLSFVFLAFACCFSACNNVKNLEAEYDKKTKQKEVLSYTQIDQLLAVFEKIPFSKLDKAYLQETGSSAFKSILSDKTYYIVKGEDVFKFAVGRIRIKDLLAEDEYYKENLKDLKANKIQYWLIDKKLLYKTLELIQTLDKLGYDKYAFTVTNGHRHPKYNDKVGGAEGSRHIRGQAIDIKIKDINKDGQATQEDKKIVLDLLENKIIGNKGGIGRYPGTMVIHYDTRGYRGRWDQQKPRKKST